MPQNETRSFWLRHLSYARAYLIPRMTKTKKKWLEKNRDEVRTGNLRVYFFSHFLSTFFLGNFNHNRNQNFYF